MNTSECAWSQVSMKILGRTLTGCLGFEFKKGIEKEHLYASGPNPVDIQTGNIKVEGSIKVLKYELDLMNDAAQNAGYNDITEVPHTLISITCAFKKLKTDPMRTIQTNGVAFTELSVAMEQNAKNTPVTLPFIALEVKHK